MQTTFQWIRRISLSLSLLFNSPPSWADSVVPVSIDNGNYRPLGAGFDSRKSLFRGDCVESSSQERMQLTSGKLDLKMEASQESLSSKLGLSAGGRYRSGATTTTASAEFLNDSRSNGYSISYNYVAESLYREYLENKEVSPIKPRPGIEKYLTDARPFFMNCGDEYVYAQDKAARLFVNMNISFVSKYERTRFAASFGVDSPIFNVKANLESDSSKFSSNSQIRVSVLQVGGDPSKLGRILCPTKADGQVDEECAINGKRVVNCGFGDIKPCMDVIANVIAYANAQDGDNFPHQIENGKNYSVVNLYTRPFVYIGSQYPAPPEKTTEDLFQAEVKQLSDIFESQYSNWSYSNKLWTGKAPRLSPRQKNEMEVLQDVFYQNMKRASVGIQNCYDFGFSKCAAELAETKEFVGYGKKDAKGYADIEALTSAETFVQFCDLDNAENPDISLTIKSLRLYAEQNKLLEPNDLKKGDFCFKLDDRMKSVSDLDLSPSEYVIGDLRPIAALLDLKSLNLAGKAVASVQTLSSLKNLKNLNLDGNIVEDVAPLSNLQSLEKLSLQNNRINDLSALARLNRLKSLDARGNSSALTCPLAQVSRCKLLDFSSSINLALNSNQCESRVGHSSVVLDSNRVLVTGGYSSNGINTFKSSIEIRGRDGCTSLPNTLLSARGDHQMTMLLDGRILISGGYTDLAEVLDPVTMKSKFANRRMQNYRSHHTATLLKDGRVLIVGGYTDEIPGRYRSKNISATAEVFNPADSSFEYLGRLTLPRAEHTATLLADGRVIIIGGFGGQRMIDMIEVIDVAAKSIKIMDEPLQLARMGHAATTLSDGRVLIAGGYVWQTVSLSGVLKQVLAATSSLEICDFTEQTCDEISDSLNEARGDLFAATMKDGRVMLVAGETQGVLFTDLEVPLISASSTIEIFDPKTEGVYKVGKLNYSRSRFSVAPLNDRSLLIIGGAGSPSASMTSELIVYRAK